LARRESTSPHYLLRSDCNLCNGTL